MIQWQSQKKVETNMGEGCDVNVLVLLGKTFYLFLFKINLKFNWLTIVESEYQTAGIKTTSC